MAPPPAHGLAQQVPKWFGFFPSPLPPRLHTPKSPGSRETTGKFGAWPPRPSPSTLKPGFPRRTEGNLQPSGDHPCSQSAQGWQAQLHQRTLRLRSGLRHRAWGTGCCFCSWAGAEQRQEGVPGTDCWLSEKALSPNSHCTEQPLPASDCPFPGGRPRSRGRERGQLVGERPFRGDPKPSLSQPSPSRLCVSISNCSWTEPPHPPRSHLGESGASSLKTNSKQNKISLTRGKTLETKKNRDYP